MLTELLAVPPPAQCYPVLCPAASTQLQREVDLQEAARLWYRDVYRPMAARDRRSHLRRALKDHTVGDIFFDILQYQVEASRERGRAITLDEAFVGFEAASGAYRAKDGEKGIEAVTAPLPLPPKAVEKEDDQATAGETII